MRRNVRIAKSTASRMKTVKMATCQTTPAIMRFVPVSAKEVPGSAELAIPPPAPWRASARMSQGMKIRGYQAAGMREFSRPNVVTILERQKYIPAARKAGAIVKQQTWIINGFCAHGLLYIKIRPMYPISSHRVPRIIAIENPINLLEMKDCRTNTTREKPKIAAKAIFAARDGR
ncbi:hypothetical protein ACKS0A_02639 [Histoplasma ohiense]